MDKIKENYWNYEQFPKASKPCPHCKNGMHSIFVPVFSLKVLPSNPPQKRWYWRCDGCSHEELGGVHRYASPPHGGEL